MGIIKTLDESIPYWMGDSLITVTFFEVKSGSGKSVLDMVNYAK